MKTPKIFTWPNDCLASVAEACVEGDESIIPTAIMMAKIMKGQGIGLAAPQIGINKRIIVGEAPNWRFCLINPEIIKQSSQETSLEERCLSIPGMSLVVARPKQITVRGFNLNWNPVKIKARGLLAACLQHEIDHLNGITLANRPVQ